MGGYKLSKKSKSKRFVQQGKDAVQKHSERFPYRERYSDVEERKNEEVDNNTGGF